MKSILIATEASGSTGWGQFGLHLGWFAHKAGWAVTFGSADLSRAPLGYALAQPWFTLVNHKLNAPKLHYTVVVGTGGNHFVQQRPVNVTADRWVTATFFEDAAIHQREVDAYNAADLTVCGSAWNHDLLTKAGVTNCQTIVQGVDSAVWHPNVPKRKIFGDRRVIFSGGKLEYRKGFPLLAAAFREYLQEDADALLLTSVQNLWPKTMRGIELFGATKGWPPLRSDGTQDITEWLHQNGIPRRNVCDTGLLPNWVLASIVAEADLAIIPALAEGGNSMPAVECLALGIPTYVTGNCTGLCETESWGALPLESEPVTTHCPLYESQEGWRRPTIGGMLAALRGPLTTMPSSPLTPPIWKAQSALMLASMANDMGVPA